MTKFAIASLVILSAASKTMAQQQQQCRQKLESFEGVAVSEEPVLTEAFLIDQTSSSCMCKSDYDCNRPKCVFNPYTREGTCSAGNTTPTSAPTHPPTNPPTLGNCCTKTRTIPTKCEVDILIDMLELAVAGDHKLAAQWLCLAFHDAGTFNTATGEGGANGCLMTFPDVQNVPENNFLDLPINTLKSIKNAWQGHPSTCLDVSAADMIQFVGHFASLQQVSSPPLTNPGMTSGKVSQLKSFCWGCPDETNCDTDWTFNLPGFQLNTQPSSAIALRCKMAGVEIKNKTMDRNGFTVMEATALIGPHTIGLTRSTFGSSLAGLWVANSADNATAKGPVFDNSFFNFLDNTIVEDSAPAFESNVSPFTQPFPDWFRDVPNNLNHLDTDLALAFPAQDGTHPNYHQFTESFAKTTTIYSSEFSLPHLGRCRYLGSRLLSVFQQLALLVMKSQN